MYFEYILHICYIYIQTSFNKNYRPLSFYNLLSCSLKFVFFIFYVLFKLLIQKKFFAKLLYKTNYNIRKIFRKLETTRKKILKRQWSIIFIKRCLDIIIYILLSTLVVCFSKEITMYCK